MDRPPQSARRVLGRAAKQREPAWEVVDDFPEDIAVLPREVRVIETYLARLLDESLEAATLGTGIPLQPRQPKRMGNRLRAR